MDFIFFILDYISKSSFRRGVIYEPRYLKLLVKWILAPLGRVISSGSLLCIFASFKDAGKNIASDFALVIFEPKCIIVQNVRSVHPRHLLHSLVHFCLER
jgi:hypothetical protein